LHLTFVVCFPRCWNWGGRFPNARYHKQNTPSFFFLSLVFARATLLMIENDDRERLPGQVANSEASVAHPVDESPKGTKPPIQAMINVFDFEAGASKFCDKPNNDIS
jgi:hypothetical protein